MDVSAIGLGAELHFYEDRIILQVHQKIKF